MITTRAQKEQTLKNEISRSLLIQQNEKDFWLKKITILPEINLDRLLAQFQNKNKIVDGFLASALEKDPDHQYLSKLKNLLNQLKKNSFQLEESQQHQNAESFLENNLNNL